MLLEKNLNYAQDAIQLPELWKMLTGACFGIIIDNPRGFQGALLIIIAR
jgi:hypothetical protein